MLIETPGQQRCFLQVRSLLEKNFMTGCETISPQELAKLVRGAKSIAAFTGAGLSTSAGLCDYRGPRGLYTTRQYDPEKIFNTRSFLRTPRYFYEYAWGFATMAARIRPTFAHQFLSRLAAGIVTQNIDLLHNQAGSKNVIELHGSFGSATCLGCGQRFRNLTFTWWLEVMSRSQKKPIAQCTCGGLLRPDIVFFGEQVHQYGDAEGLIGNCDLLLVLGSSLTVSPASELLFATSAPTVVINQGWTDLGVARHRFKVDANLDEYLRKVAEFLLPE